jgi:hypothetical protein
MILEISREVEEARYRRDVSGFSITEALRIVKREKPCFTVRLAAFLSHKPRRFGV